VKLKYLPEAGKTRMCGEKMTKWQTPCGLVGDTVYGNDAGAHMLVAHGLMGSRAGDDATAMPDWRLLCEQPGVASLSRYDARGHGQSCLDHDPEKYHWAQAGRDLLTVMKNLPVSPTILIGSSMGAAAILHAITHHPDVRGVVLAIPPTTGADRDPMRPIYQRWATHVRERGTVDFIDYLYSLPPTPLFARDDPDMRTRNYPHLTALEAGSLSAAYIGAAQSDWPDAAKLRNITVPCLILCRDLDATHPIMMGEKLADLLPNSTLIISRDCADIGRWPEKIASWLIEIS